MNILIDTHIFLWMMFDTNKISHEHRNFLTDYGNNLYVSSLSVAEIMVKRSLNKLDIDFDLDYALEQLGVNILDFDAKSALLLGILPFHHHDPFDRMIISQAITNKYKIISIDKKFKNYDCELL